MADLPELTYAEKKLAERVAKKTHLDPAVLKTEMQHGKKLENEREARQAQVGSPASQDAQQTYHEPSAAAMYCALTKVGNAHMANATAESPVDNQYRPLKEVGTECNLMGAHLKVNLETAALCSAAVGQLVLVQQEAWGPQNKQEIEKADAQCRVEMHLGPRPPAPPTPPPAATNATPPAHTSEQPATGTAAPAPTVYTPVVSIPAPAPLSASDRAIIDAAVAKSGKSPVEVEAAYRRQPPVLSDFMRDIVPSNMIDCLVNKFADTQTRQKLSTYELEKTVCPGKLTQADKQEYDAAGLAVFNKILASVNSGELSHMVGQCQNPQPAAPAQVPNNKAPGTPSPPPH